MVKDYAKKTFRHKRKTKNSSQHFGLYVLIILLFSLFFTGLYYKKMKSAKQSDAAHVAHSRITPAVAQAPTKPPSPVFEFYTLLPKAKKTGNKTQAPFPAPITKQVSENYFLQIAALQHQEEADSLKAKLLLLGFDVVTKTTVIKGETWYRVSIGPYSTLADLHTDQDRLRENHIDSMLQRAQP